MQSFVCIIEGSAQFLESLSRKETNHKMYEVVIQCSHFHLFVNVKGFLEELY